MPLTRADLDAAIAAVDVQSVIVYRRRQDLEQARITIAQQIFSCEQDMIKLDGEKTALTRLLKASDGE